MQNRGDQIPIVKRDWVQNFLWVSWDLGAHPQAGNFTCRYSHHIGREGGAAAGGRDTQTKVGDAGMVLRNAPAAGGARRAEGQTEELGPHPVG